ncbi:hypothetical protein BZG36_01804 [Bifiguratus adelaidae]|uniref:Succinate dehydrogenase [ubiquinone] cytochrome b small subunit n=1 Tax=Bifiguratus adelaidae TaxID=1938954 RepID=A0A261Y2C6_9FUNG|nr:hypothetical protein BZG36_01804 [Bifiguratus adelaidae]
MATRLATPQQLSAVLNRAARQKGALAFHTGRVLGVQSSKTVFARAAVPATPTTVAVPEPNRVDGSFHWSFERGLSVALVPLISAQLIQGGAPVTDMLLGVVLPLHCHLGFDSCITDYFDERKSPVLNKLMTWTLRAATVGVLVGCYQINTHDVGLTEMVGRAWVA